MIGDKVQHSEGRGSNVAESTGNLEIENTLAQQFDSFVGLGEADA